MLIGLLRRAGRHVSRAFRQRLQGLLHSDDLDQLAIRYGSDKRDDHFYTSHYQKHFAHLRKQKLNISRSGSVVIKTRMSAALHCGCGKPVSRIAPFMASTSTIKVRSRKTASGFTKAASSTAIVCSIRTARWAPSISSSTTAATSVSM